MSLMLEKQMVDPGWHQIHRYAYVKRAYEDVWTAVAADPTLVLPDGIRLGGVGPLPLKVRLAGVEVTRPVVVHIGGLVVEDGRSRLGLAWWDKGHRNLFPVLEAVIELVPADFRGGRITQIGLVGRYRPPFGAFGSAVDLVAGADIVAESAMRFVQDVAERIEAALPPAGIAAVDYDPDRCTPEDLRVALEADAGQKLKLETQERQPGGAPCLS